MIPLIASVNATVGIPQVSTRSALNVLSKSATLQGYIENNHGSDCIEYGFEFGSSQEPYRTFKITGTFTPAQYTHSLAGLNEISTYYFRFYAINASGIAYGGWQEFTTGNSNYSIKINGVERSFDVITGSIGINDKINDEQNTCAFQLVDRHNNGLPDPDETVIIQLDDNSILFSGYVLGTKLKKTGNGIVFADVNCVDFGRLLDGNLVHRSYIGDTDIAIVQDIISRYCSGKGITIGNITDVGITISQISFNYIQPSEAIRKLAELTNRYWYIDYTKDIHYFDIDENATPISLDDDTQVKDLTIVKDGSQIKNRIYVRGGTKLSDETSVSQKGDGVLKKFVLPEKPHDVSLFVNGVEKTVGIKNIDTTGFDWYLNFQEKYIEQAAAGTVLSTSDTLEVFYKYEIPILVAQENVASIADHGTKEFAIFDKTITTTQAARDRATAELVDYAEHCVEASFTTLIDGFKSGQTLPVNLTEYGVVDDYIIQSVQAQSIGGGEFEYSVTAVSSKTRGIIRFLLEMLEANKSTVVLDNSEVVDELFNVTDATGDITDSLTATLGTPTAEWGTFKWGMFQWS